MAACDLLISDIHHTRHGQPSHFLARRGLSIWVDLDRLTEADQQSRFFSVGKFNVLSFLESDYGPNFDKKKPVTSLAAYVRNIVGKILSDAHVAHVRLLTFPRILGLSFNPLSVYVAQNDQGTDILYIYEVRNTFGDMHAYIGTPIDGPSILEAQKIFHVSPFFPVSGSYRLHIRHDKAYIKVIMRYMIGSKPALTATMRGGKMPLSSRSLWMGLWRTGQWPLRPLLSIHVEAVKLWMKKLQFHKRPAPPTSPWSKARNSSNGL